ncbi:MAG: CoA activase [Chloroflexi bacterium]|nr:CoA activase [Chloroflexota bacterium]
MIVVGGCDVGSATGKAVVMNDGTIASYVVILSTTRPEVTARLAMDEAIKKAGLVSIEDLSYIVGTGYGRLRVPFAAENISEITCHAYGAHWLCPTVRTVIDIGGQDCKVMSVSSEGKVNDFVMNDKCAAGTGRFFEAMARVLDCGLEGLSRLPLQATKPAKISSQCSVFAESEVITLVNDGVDLADIVAGLNQSIASRLATMVGRVGLIEDVALTGGCAKNQGLVRALQDKLQAKVITLPEDPQIVGALGAALIARGKIDRKP